MNHNKSTLVDDEGQNDGQVDGQVVLVVDPNDPDDEGGFCYNDADGNEIEWHTSACPCELCRVSTLELLERVAASRPPLPECDGEDCQGREGCPGPPRGQTADEMLKEENEWHIARLHSFRPDQDEDFWRAVVESEDFGLPLLPLPPGPSPYPGFEDFVRAVESKGDTKPALLKRSDGATILYANRSCTIFAEPGMAKTWMGIEAALASVKLGGRVLWWDFEDKPDTFHDRGKALGKEELKILKGPNVAFVDYSLQELHDGGVAQQALARAIEWLAQAGLYSLVVIDAAYSSGAPSDGSPVTEWLEQMIVPFRQRKRSVGVLTLDHVPKSRIDRPRGAIGSQDKLAAVDGVAYSLSGRPWTETEDGVMTLRLEKDRLDKVPGHQGSKVATITGRTVKGRLTISIDPPANKDDDGGADVSMLLLAAIAGAGEEGIRGQNVLFKKVTGKGQAKVEALTTLIGDGLVVQSKSGKAQVHKITDAGMTVLDEGADSGE